jgi:hypothetical protein
LSKKCSSSKNKSILKMIEALETTSIINTVQRNKSREISNRDMPPTLIQMKRRIISMALTSIAVAGDMARLIFITEIQEQTRIMMPREVLLTV